MFSVFIAQEMRCMLLKKWLITLLFVLDQESH